MLSRKLRAFTLVELLVVIAIIGILVALLFPAIQAAREAARRSQCKNHIRNLAQASILHLEANKYFPTGGWGWRWAGDPDRGYGSRQPGGWVYSILPFIEEGKLHDLGKGQNDAVKRAAGKIRVGTPVSLFNCPTRRRPEQFPFTHGTNYYNIDKPTLIARIDYAANGGDTGYAADAGPDLTTLQMPINTAFYALMNQTNLKSTGIVSTASQYKGNKVTDGFTKTYLIGERYLHFTTYEGGSPSDDDQGWDVAYDFDTVRWTNTEPKFDVQVSNPNSGNENFGSIHLGGFQIAMCDGSVKTVTYEINLAIHRQAGHRNDGGPAGNVGID